MVFSTSVSSWHKREQEVPSVIPSKIENVLRDVRSELSGKKYKFGKMIGLNK